jgi:YD repeat-containing protein
MRSDRREQIDQAPEGTTTRTWNYENQPTLEVLPSGQRATMAYNANFRRTRKES